jgi:hypothetical protein
MSIPTFSAIKSPITGSDGKPAPFEFSRAFSRQLNTWRTQLANLAGMIFTSPMTISGVQVFANNAAAVAAGLTPGQLYRTGADPDIIAVVH